MNHDFRNPAECRCNPFRVGEFWVHQDENVPVSEIVIIAAPPEPEDGEGE